MPSIDVSADGVMPGSSKNSINISTRRVNSRHSSWIQRLSVHMASAAGAPKKNGGQQSEALGRSQGGFTTKLNAAVSDAFLPLRFTLTAGARHDVTQATALIDGYTCQYIIADAAYDSDCDLREYFAS